ncbi:MAG: phosphatase PAP2 family protein [Halobacteriovoraceae bacterium]|nr:phosphatase PAP2 family protein [Halobacteriovoraceae bacterium]|tara:strand:- start:9257 stop:9847 length:591 start_codon:yes stop_codon:yes gene_type:complete
MIQTLNEIDTKLFVYLNSLHNEWLDQFMLYISYNKYFMILVLMALCALASKVYHKKFIGLFFALVLAFGLSDSISTRVFKDNFERLRPCHQEALKDSVNLAGKKCWGGKFGFVSSHASNSFAIMTFFILLLKAKYSWIWLLYVYSSLVAYSRVYLAKHFPGDVIVGALLGILISTLVLKLIGRFFPQLKPIHQNQS